MTHFDVSIEPIAFIDYQLGLFRNDFHPIACRGSIKTIQQGYKSLAHHLLDHWYHLQNASLYWLSHWHLLYQCDAQEHWSYFFKLKLNNMKRGNFIIVQYCSGSNLLQPSWSVQHLLPFCRGSLLQSQALILCWISAWLPIKLCATPSQMLLAFNKTQVQLVLQLLLWYYAEIENLLTPALTLAKIIYLFCHHSLSLHLESIKWHLKHNFAFMNDWAGSSIGMTLF